MLQALRKMDGLVAMQGPVLAPFNRQRFKRWNAAGNKEANGMQDDRRRHRGRAGSCGQAVEGRGGLRAACSGGKIGLTSEASTPPLMAGAPMPQRVSRCFAVPGWA